MTLRHLQIFAEVAECKKMSEAAAKLYISQPTVSQAIRELEEYYGVLLFERLNKRLVITMAGERLYRHAKDILMQYGDMENSMSEISKRPFLRIGATLTVGSRFLPDILKSFKHRRPDVDTFCLVNNTAAVEEGILSSRLDIGVVEGIVKSDDIKADDAIADELVLVCSKNHPFYNKNSITFSQLIGQRFVLREKGSGTRELFELDLKKHHIDIVCAWEAFGTESLMGAVKNDGCLCVLSYCLVEPYMENGELKVFKNVSGSWKRSFKIAVHKDKHRSATIDDFIATVESFKREDPLNDAVCGVLR